MLDFYSDASFALRDGKNASDTDMRRVQSESRSDVEGERETFCGFSGSVEHFGTKILCI